MSTPLSVQAPAPPVPPEPAVRSRRRLAGLLLCLLALAAVCLLSITIGTRNIAPHTVWDAFAHPVDSDDQTIVRELRLPRTVLGLLAGAALGVCGALIQAVTRNPLADTQVLGVNSGASLFVVVAIGLFGLTSIWAYVWFAFAGVAVALVLVYALGSAGSGGATPVRLTLAGVALGAVMDGISSGIRMVRPRAFDYLRFWDVGTLTGRPMPIAATVAVFILAGLVLAAVAARSLNAVALGDDLARSLGTSVTRTRVLTVAAVMLLAGGATAAVGPIGFVGLMVPHAVRWFTGPDQRWIMAYTAVAAPVLLLAADVVGRVVIRPGELRSGIVTALIGAPVLILLVRRAKARSV
ncbi:iron chelate uptake ABC transporter family permease subunit [Catellatospora sp. KI3]|uniref:FecCD family ABC transporter permease n=1 Tax=Catellatospora sp. KI3 TaxID=3041620 RepID=UPI0024827D2A|nr:iron chelate uptake ABC transporter family permease subunit [Catellatospora sp. KI3]MDI1461641.1 iron chelate uptake ABC transporter family permease subunit [Catellatospora sp. KI3]